MPNPFAPLDELELGADTHPRSLFGEILDWMLAPLLLLWPMSIAVTYIVAKSIANGPFDRAHRSRCLCQSRGKSSRSMTSPNCGCPTPPAISCVPTACSSKCLACRGELVGGDRDMSLPHEDDRPQPGIVEFRDDMLRGNDIRVATRPPTAESRCACGSTRPISTACISKWKTRAWAFRRRSAGAWSSDSILSYPRARGRWKRTGPCYRQGDYGDAWRHARAGRPRLLRRAATVRNAGTREPAAGFFLCGTNPERQNHKFPFQ